MPLVQYAIAELSDCVDIIRLLARVFSQSEPPAVAMRLTVEDMEQFLALAVPGVIPHGLTVVSRDAQTGSLTGVLFTDDFAAPPVLDVSRISPKFLPIFSMLGELDEQFRNGRTISPGEYLHLFMLAVDAQFAGQGIGQTLIRTCIENGTRKGYQIALTEATGKVSQHIFRKNGFVDRFSVSYQTFTFENRVVFASIREHERAILMERRITEAQQDRSHGRIPPTSKIVPE